MTNRSRQLVAVIALVLGFAGSVPLITAVHGQQPQTALQYEAQNALERITKLEAQNQNTAAMLAGIAEHAQMQDKIADARYAEEVAFRNKVLYGLLGLGGSAMLAVFGWFLGHFVQMKTPEGSNRRKAA